MDRTSRSPLIVLGHGASGTAASMRPWVDGLGNAGLDAVAVNLRRGRAEDAVPGFLLAVPGDRPVVLGGHSFGGRVASLAATTLLVGGGPGIPGRARPAGLVLLSYPLHRPGHPETVSDRTAHWPLLTCPVLLLSGDRDPFAQAALLAEAVRLLPNARLIVHPGMGHGLLPIRDLVLPEIVAFVRSAVA